MDSSHPAAASYKIMVLGNSSVGKTALISRISTGEFLPTTATVGIDFIKYPVTLTNGVVVNLQIWDTAGQERFRNITRSYYRGAHGVVYVYDVTNPSSFQDLKYWLDSVKEMVASGRDDKAPVAILLGNKNDLQDCKMIKNTDGEQVRDRNTLYGFYEVSAKTGENVDKAFKDLAFFLVDNYNGALLKGPTAVEQTSSSSSASPSITSEQPTSRGSSSSTTLSAAPRSPTVMKPNPFATTTTDGGNTVKLGSTPTNNNTKNNSDCKC